MIYDYAVVGAGIVGLSAAYKLSQARPDCTIAILEKEDRVAAHQTGRNSGVIHSGIYYQPGSYKLKNCVDGRRQLVDFCKKHGMVHDICGKVIVAAGEEEIPALQAIYKRGLKNGIENISLLDSAGLREIEPFVEGAGAIHVPCAGIVDFEGICKKLMELLSGKGHRFFFKHTVTDVYQNNGTTAILTGNGTIKAKYLVNCAGLYSDRIARSSGMESPVKIVPFRGEYFQLAEKSRHKVKSLIYPLPNPEFPFLGVHFTRMALGGVECGPNAVFAFKREGYSKISFSLKDTAETITYPGFWKLAAKHWKTGTDEIHRSFSKKAFLKTLQRLIPSIEADDLVPSPSGVRAMALQPDGEIMDDFCFRRTGNQLHVLNAPSPAATAALAIGDEICRRIVGK